MNKATHSQRQATSYIQNPYKKQIEKGDTKKQCHFGLINQEKDQLITSQSFQKQQENYHILKISFLHLQNTQLMRRN